MPNDSRFRPVFPHIVQVALTAVAFAILNKVGYSTSGTVPATADTAIINGTLTATGRVIVLANGRVAAQGTPDEVRHSDDPLVHQFVHALPEGPVHFHYPGPSVAEDFSGGLE